MVYAPVPMPEAPSPVIARPTISVVESKDVRSVNTEISYV